MTATSHEPIRPDPLPRRFAIVCNLHPEWEPDRHPKPFQAQSSKISRGLP
jgi:hypothetical protein